MTGGRLKRVRAYVGDDETFCFTYGDGVADIDITAIAFHRAQDAGDGHRSRSRPAASARSTRRQSRHQLSARSRAATVAGSTAGFSCCPPRSRRATSRVTQTVWESEPMTTSQRTAS